MFSTSDFARSRYKLTRKHRRVSRGSESLRPSEILIKNVPLKLPQK